MHIFWHNDLQPFKIYVNIGKFEGKLAYLRNSNSFARIQEVLYIFPTSCHRKFRL